MRDIMLMLSALLQLERASVVSVPRRSATPGGANGAPATGVAQSKGPVGPGYERSSGPGYEQQSLNAAARQGQPASGITPAP